MTSGTLEAITSTQLVRNTVHEQYEGRALGFFMLNQLVPIVLNIPLPGNQHVKAILVWGNNTQKYVPFTDLGLVSKECIRVFLFNIRHYVKCYLNSGSTEPYTYNLCKFCGAEIHDDNNGYIRQIAKINYRANMYIYQPTKALQNDTGIGDLFNYQERGQSCSRI